MSSFTCLFLALISLMMVVARKNRCPTGTWSHSNTTHTGSGMMSGTSMSMSATSSAPASSATLSTSTVGLGWSPSSGDDMPAFQAVNGSRLSWYFNWNLGPNVNPANVEFVPQVKNAIVMTTINETAWPAITEHIISFYMPDQTSGGGANLTAATAATLHQQWVSTLTGTYQIGKPAVSQNSGTWLQDWITACNNMCEYDFIPFSFYDTNVTDLISYAETINQQFMKPVWVTEWACMNATSGASCSATDSQTFMEAAITFFETTSYVERWAWFGAFLGVAGEGIALVNADGTPSALGELYVTL